MAKGKYRQRKDNRDATQLAADLAAARAECTRELARLAAVKARVDQDKRLRAELAAAIELRDRACAPQLGRIAADRVAVQKATRDLAVVCKSIDRHRLRVIEWAIKELGAELFLAVLTGDRAVIRSGVSSNGVSNSAAEVIQRARGLRTRAALDFTREQKIVLGQAAAAATGLQFPHDYADSDDEAAWTAFSDVVAADTAALIAFRAPLPWLDIAVQREHPVSRALGAAPDSLPPVVDAAATIVSIAEVSTGTAAVREGVAVCGATAVASAWSAALQEGVNRAASSQIPDMVSGAAAYPAPADAEALHAWYSLAAMGAWGRDRSVANGRIAVAAAAAVPFWLPAGHTIAYLDSEPLSEEDVEELRLPFAQVLVTFAEPARLPVIDSAAVPAGDGRLSWMDHAVASNEGHPEPRSLILAGTNNFNDPLPGLWDVIAARGAHIEGVLLLGDGHGRLEDLFAWCVAVPSTAAGGALGRWVIPASRSSTVYGNLVVNAAAVAAWADWHRPGQCRDGGETQPVRDEKGVAGRNQVEGRVHVLNVTATAVADEPLRGRGDVTGRTTAPHRRRGHWRRQHYGPARASTRRIRIAPVMVNAGRPGSERPQIYRLPAPR